MDKRCIYEVRVMPDPQKTMDGRMVPAGVFLRRAKNSWQWLGAPITANSRQEDATVDVLYYDVFGGRNWCVVDRSSLSGPARELFAMLRDYPHDPQAQPMLKSWLRQKALGEDVIDQMVLPLEVACG